mmetsp:Transcript_29110/g.62714  ORF Transcript_29110/g.62714 Transcript_29110/m.62714 type:complete len:205 (-) Transcript_29110:2488-3102(-)
MGMKVWVKWCPPLVGFRPCGLVLSCLVPALVALHVLILVLLDVVQGGLGQDQLARVVVAEVVVLLEQIEGEHLGRVLHEPPADAVQPDVHRQLVGLSSCKAQGVDTIGVGGGPDAGEDGGDGKREAASAQQYGCGRGGPEPVLVGAGREKREEIRDGHLEVDGGGDLAVRETSEGSGVPAVEHDVQQDQRGEAGDCGEYGGDEV